MLCAREARTTHARRSPSTRTACARRLLASSPIPPKLRTSRSLKARRARLWVRAPRVPPETRRGLLSTTPTAALGSCAGGAPRDRLSTGMCEDEPQGRSSGVSRGAPPAHEPRAAHHTLDMRCTCVAYYARVKQKPPTPHRSRDHVELCEVGDRRRRPVPRLARRNPRELFEGD